MTHRNLIAADPVPNHALGATSSRVLSVLRDASTTLTVGQVAARVGLHANTVRAHLNALVGDGLAERANEERTQVGRPHALYTATTGATRCGRRNFRLLAQILASYLDSRQPRPAEAALYAGEQWGRYLVERPAPFERVEADSAMRQLRDGMNDVGSAAEAVIVGGTRQLLLHQCPFREVAERHRDVACAVHLGLMRGLLAELDAPIDVTRLDPRVEPSLCVTHIGPAQRAERPRRGPSRPASTAGSSPPGHATPSPGPSASLDTTRKNNLG